MPASGRTSQRMVESDKYEVTTRPLHLFSLLVEFCKGREYSQILPPNCTAPPLEPEQPPQVSCFLLAFWEISDASISKGSYWKWENDYGSSVALHPKRVPKKRIFTARRFWDVTF